MKHIIGLMAMLLPILCGAQSPPVKALNIGDTVPDITLTKVYNYPDSIIKLSDLKGKLIILDFWATWCGACIQTFPKMHDLKKEFGEKLQIIMVNSYNPDSVLKVKSFLDKRKERTALSFELTYSLQDTLLARLFPYKQIPHNVWIKNGVIVAITSSTEVNSNNIDAVLKHSEISLAVKNDNLLFNKDKPLLIDENGGDEPDFLYRSIITGYKNNIGAVIGQRTDEDRMIIRMFVINYPISVLFAKAYRDIYKFPVNRLIVEAPINIKEAFDNPNSFKYCYEIITAQSSDIEIQKYMQEDLYRAFHLRAKNEIRNLDCYMVRTNKNLKRSLSNGGDPGLDVERTSTHKFIKNKSISPLISLIESATNKIIIDQTNLDSKIDMEIPKNIHDFSIEKLTAYLHERGFDLIPGNHPIEVVVISGL